MHTMPHQNAVAQFDALDVIVGLSLLFSLAWLIAWLFSPQLRAWIERPKYRFQENVRSYDKVGSDSLNAPDPDAGLSE